MEGMQSTPEPMIICVWFPRFALTVLDAARVRSGNPVALVCPEQQQILDVSESARDAGVTRGMTVSRAMGACHDASFVVYDEVRVSDAWQKFMRRIESAGAAVEPWYVTMPDADVSDQEVAWFDGSGLKLLYGGAEGIVDAVLQAVPRARELRIGIADTRFTAWVAARTANPHSFVLVGEEQGPREWLAGFPSGMLPLSARHAELFAALGLETIGDVADLPLDAVADRLGHEGIRIWQHARGIDRVAMQPVLPIENHVERMSFPDPVTNDIALGEAVRILTLQAASHESFRLYAPHSLTLIVGFENSAGGDEILRSVHVALREPTTDAEKLRLAVSAKAVALATAPISSVELRFESFVAKHPDQPSLIDTVKARAERATERAVSHVQIATGDDESVLEVIEVAPQSRLIERQRALVARRRGSQ